jgi:hypothetical protein
MGAGLTKVVAPITQSGGLVLCAGALVDFGMAYCNQWLPGRYRKS